MRNAAQAALRFARSRQSFWGLVESSVTSYAKTTGFACSSPILFGRGVRVSYFLLRNYAEPMRSRPLTLGMVIDAVTSWGNKPASVVPAL